MKVILLDNVKKVGTKYEIVTVKPGFAQNFLIPQGLARLATPAAEKEIEKLQAAAQADRAANEAELAKMFSAVDGKEVTITAKANEQGHLFAALHADQLAAAVADQLKVTIDPEHFASKDAIKEAGKCDLHLQAGDTTATISLVVVAEK